MLLQIRMAGLPGLALVMLCAGLTCAQPEPAADRAIPDLIQQLADPQFAVRSAATEALIASEAGAISAVADALRTSHDIEVQSRCTEILSAWASSKDSSIAAAAVKAIDAIAADATAAGTRRARQLQGQLLRARRIEAIQGLREQGAVLNSRDETLWGNRGWINPLLPGNGPAPVVAVDEAMVRLVLDEHWRGTSQHLALLQRLPEIEEVILDHPQVGVPELEAISHLPNLTHLVIRCAKVRDKDLAVLAKLPQLTTLSIMYMPMTDASVDILESYPSLRWLALLGTEISADRLKALQSKRRDGLTIEQKSGAFLGISPLPVTAINREEGLCLGSITAGGSADHAGLLPGDYLLRFDGQPVTDFETLKGQIGSRRPGDTVELQIRRGDREMKKKITLGKWSSADWWVASMQNHFNPAPVVPAPNLPPALPREKPR